MTEEFYVLMRILSFKMFTWFMESKDWSSYNCSWQDHSLSMDKYGYNITVWAYESLSLLIIPTFFIYIIFP